MACVLKVIRDAYTANDIACIRHLDMWKPYWYRGPSCLLQNVIENEPNEEYACQLIIWIIRRCRVNVVCWFGNCHIEAARKLGRDQIYRVLMDHGAGAPNQSAVNARVGRAKAVLVVFLGASQDVIVKPVARLIAKCVWETRYQCHWDERPLTFLKRLKGCIDWLWPGF